MTMNDENVAEEWVSCNKMIGRILTYLDEANVGLGTKKAVKSEVWDFYNKYVNEDEYDSTTRLS